MNIIALKTNVLLAILKLLAHLPFCVLYLVSDVISFFLRYVIHYRQKVVFGNLSRSFPEKSDAEVEQISKKFYQHLGDLIVETIKLLHISDRQLEQHITVLGGDLIERLASDGRPIVVFLGHYGNWEWVQEVTRHYHRPAINAELYRPIKDPVLDEVMKHIRGRFDTILIQQKQALRQLLGWRQEGEQFLVGFISDQRPYAYTQHPWTTWLNQDSEYVTGGEDIGRHINAHFVFLEVRKPSRGYYEMEFQEIRIEDCPEHPHPYTMRFLQLMEQCICREPAYWLWSHNRWKFDRDRKKIH